MCAVRPYITDRGSARRGGEGAALPNPGAGYQGCAAPQRGQATDAVTLALNA